MPIGVPCQVPEVIVPTLARLEAVVNADRVVSVALLVAVTFAAVPVVFAALLGISAETRALKVGAAAEPEAGPAQTELALWLFKEPVSVPLEVTGEPETVKTLTGSARATLVTEPADGLVQLSTPVPSLVSTYPEEAACAGGKTKEYVVVVPEAVKTTCPDVDPSNCRPPPPSSNTLELLEKSTVLPTPLMRLKSFEKLAILCLPFYFLIANCIIIRLFSYYLITLSA
jgi:hypothetical protein